MMNFIKKITLKNNTKIKIISKLSGFVLCDTENKEVNQTIEIFGNGRFEFISYNFNKEVLRNKKDRIKKCDVLKVINEIKNILDNMEPYPIAKDSDSWEIEININGEIFSYFGNFIKENELIYKDKINISEYLKSIINIDNLYLLDGIKKDIS